MDCSANIRVDSFSETTGDITFVADVSNCTDSTGYFDYEFIVEDEHGVPHSYLKSAGWNRTFNSDSTGISEQIHLGSNERLTSVKIEPSSIVCSCFTDGSQFSKHSNMNSPQYTVDDSETLESLNEVFSKTSAYRSLNYRIVRVHELKISWADIRTVAESATELPDTIEQTIIEFRNATSTDKSFDRDTKIETTRGITYEKYKSFFTKKTVKVGLKVDSPQGLSANLDLISENSLTVSERATQNFKMDITLNDRTKFVVPPFTTYVAAFRVEKGRIAVPIVGRIIVDAKFLMQRSDYPVLKGVFWLSDAKLLPNPEDRYIDFEGRLISETFTKYDISYDEKALDRTGKENAGGNDFSDDGVITTDFSTFVGNG